MDFTLSEGDAFVVCDASGGAVDLISYEVTGLTPNLQLKESVPGSGVLAPRHCLEPPLCVSNFLLLAY